ncbi:hypothetical protein QVM88_18220 [Providencia stuartii]|nr:hypothetical protein [Providencia stuartii]
MRTTLFDGEIGMKIPLYLTHDFRLIQGNGELTEVYFGSQSTEDTFEIWFTGEVVSVDEEAQPYIMETDSHPLTIIAKHSVSGQTFLLFDGTIHGYDAMFCDQPYDEPLEQLSPIKYDFPPAILKLSFFIILIMKMKKRAMSLMQWEMLCYWMGWVCHGSKSNVTVLMPLHFLWLIRKV